MEIENIKQEIKNLNILFVDDEESVVETMKDVLPLFFNKSYFALNGQEGLELFKKHTINVVITDLSMPVMNGYDMVKKIKNKTPHTKVVFISGHNETPCKEKIKSLNAAFIVKPISSKGLFEAMKKIL